MRVNTGLPYSLDDFNIISENGANVDMSNITYPGIEISDIIKTTYIYLRNTDFKDIDLSFDKCDYKFKEEFLLYYLTGEIEYPIHECINTWIKILGLYIGLDFPSASILSKKEIETFIKNNTEYLNTIIRFIASLPLYPISRINMENDQLSFNDISKIEDKVCNNSICSIIKNDFFMNLYDTLSYNEPAFYTNIFTEDNNELFDVILKYTPFTTLLFGMCQDNWKDFVGEIETFVKDLESNA